MGTPLSSIVLQNTCPLPSFDVGTIFHGFHTSILTPTEFNTSGQASALFFADLMASNHEELPSMAVFSPQSKAPPREYLDGLRSYLCSKVELQPLVQAIEDLSKMWQVFADNNKDIANLKQGGRHTKALSDWIKYGDSSRVFNVMSGILSLPLLTIIQIGQYFQFLELKKISHQDFMARLRDRGGVQGYCGGLLPAIAIACSSNEAEVVKNASKAMRIALGIGAYGELGDDENDVAGATTIVVRLKQEGQGEELTQGFPDVSAI